MVLETKVIDVAELLTTQEEIAEKSVYAVPSIVRKDEEEPAAAEEPAAEEEAVVEEAAVEEAAEKPAAKAAPAGGKMIDKAKDAAKKMYANARKTLTRTKKPVAVEAVEDAEAVAE